MDTTKRVVFGVIVLFLIISSLAVLAETPFLQENSSVWLHVFGLGNLAHGWGPPPRVSPSGLQEHYEAKYGVYPDMVFWTDTGVSSYLIEFSMYVRPKSPERNAFDAWNPAPTWSDIEDNFMIITDNIDTGVNDTLSYLETSSTGSIEFIDGFRNTYRTRYSVDVYALLPTENKLYKVWAELWLTEDDPGTKYGVTDTIYVVKAEVETPYDSLQWSYGLEYDDVDYFHDIYRTFTYNAHINRNLFEYYYMQSNCDSVTVIGERLKSINSQEDSLIVMSDMMDLADEIDSRINDICVDGFPQPEKYGGSLFYFDKGE